MHREQFLQLGAAGGAPTGVGAALDPRAHLDLAALEQRLHALAQRRFAGAQLVAQAKAQVQKAAVDGANLDPQHEFGRVLGGCGGAQALAGAGITGHAVNWHGFTLLLI